MVLHVVGLAVLRHHLLVEAACLELGQDRLVAHSHDVGEHVEAPAVRHADHRPMSALLRGHLQDQVEHWHEGVEPLDAEPLLPQVGLVQESLESLDGGQLFQQCPLLVRGERLSVLAGLDHAPQPGPLGVVGDVLDLVGDRPAVRLAQLLEYLLEVVARNVDAQR